MNDVIDLVVQRTGISRDDAATAVQTVLEYMRQRAPGGELPGQLSALITGATGAEPGDMLKARLGDLLGGGGNR
jgi:uncharacterized protein (DUF2267 family)